LLLTGDFLNDISLLAVIAYNITGFLLLKAEKALQKDAIKLRKECASGKSKVTHVALEYP
jgi:hypothetical protein